MGILVAMAGLPGTGKSTLARKLEALLPAIVLDKDLIRAAAFPPEKIEYTTEQDDFVVQMMLMVADYLFSKNPQQIVILDGRPFAHAYQIQHLVSYAAGAHTSLRVIQCVCSDETARKRLDQEGQQMVHPAKNRGVELYLRMKAAFEPLTLPHLTVNTDRPIEECLAECLAYLRSGGD